MLVIYEEVFECADFISEVDLFHFLPSWIVTFHLKINEWHLAFGTVTIANVKTGISLSHMLKITSYNLFIASFVHGI
jgi:hypothetical protein